MKVFLLLCLLDAAFTQDFDFNWSGPVKTEQNVDGSSDQETACMTDQGSCGCCLMQKQIQRMTKLFNITVSELESQLRKTRDILNSFRASRSAFSVALNSDSSPSCFGPFSTQDKTVMYKHVFINLGGGYDVNTGAFTVPRSGVYSVALTAYGDAGAPGNALAACAVLRVNGQEAAGLSERNKDDHEDSATVALALHLKAGDKMAVNLPSGCFICDDSSHYNTFTGYLLYATD